MTIDDVEETTSGATSKALDYAKPEEALMVGDNHHDIVGGQNAGTKTVAVSWTLKGRAYLEAYKAGLYAR